MIDFPQFLESVEPLDTRMGAPGLALRPGILHANAGGPEFSRTFHLALMASVPRVSRLDFSDLALGLEDPRSQKRPGAPILLSRRFTRRLGRANFRSE